MLRSFRVANHRSIRHEQELLLMPAYDKTAPVVPVVAVFGANASGKSNLLDALAWMRSAVQGSFADWAKLPGVPRTPFKLDPAAKAEASAFVVEVVVDGTRYTYGFEVDDYAVREEWLHSYPVGRRRVVFEREGRKWFFGSSVPAAKADLIRSLTRENSLFLSVAAASGLDDVQPVFSWFTAQLRQTADGQARLEEQLAELLAAEGELRDQVVALARAADLGIVDIVVDRAAESELREIAVQAGLSLAERRRVAFLHGGGSVALVLGEQSAGTRAWLLLVSGALAALRDGSVLVADEIDVNLHPQVVERMVGLFRDRDTNPRHAQLIFSSHDVVLLDEETLGRDEVWFVDKNPQTGESRFYPLTDFKPRHGENRQRRYLAGAYGGVPVVSDSGFRAAIRGGHEAA